MPAKTSPKPAPTRGWPPARRAAQAARIRHVRPWTRAAGPRTAAGKARAARNALRHGYRSAAANGIRALLRWQKAVVKHVLRTALARQGGAIPGRAKPSPLFTPPFCVRTRPAVIIADRVAP